jgi:hypothetical protein
LEDAKEVMGWGKGGTHKEVGKETGFMIFIDLYLSIVSVISCAPH